MWQNSVSAVATRSPPGGAGGWWSTGYTASTHQSAAERASAPGAITGMQRTWPEGGRGSIKDENGRTPERTSKEPGDIGESHGGHRHHSICFAVPCTL